MNNHFVKQFFAILVWLMLLISACQPVQSMIREPNMNQNALTAQSPTAFLALGDSYTIGEAVATQERWPVQLAAQLRTDGITVTDLQIVARTGWTTDELVAGIAQAGIKGTFDLVTLLIGVNNQYRRRGVEEYRVELRGLLGQALGFADGDRRRVIVLSIPDWSVVPFSEGRDRAEIAIQIDQFNAVNREEAQAAGVNYVDITAISRQAAEDQSLVAEDGLHPSGEMYRRWVELVLPVARKVIGGRG